MHSSVHHPMLGQVIGGRYELESVLGEGGYGVVYRARQVSTGQAVAVKLLLPQKLNTTDAQVEVARFEREMRTIAQLKHPNIVRLIDSGRLPGGELYTVLEYIEGESLAEMLVREGSLRPSEAKYLMMQVLDAIASAHDLGIIHRDLKPANIMIASTGARRNALVLDFGIAAIASDHQQDDYVALTGQGNINGTPAYMAPEQFNSTPVTPQSDIYAWGLCFLEALQGARAIQGNSLGEIVIQHMDDRPLPMPPPLANHPLGYLIQRATMREMHQRYQNARQALFELERCEVGALPRLQGGAGSPPMQTGSPQFSGHTGQVNDFRNAPPPGYGNVPHPQQTPPPSASWDLAASQSYDASAIHRAGPPGSHPAPPGSRPGPPGSQPGPVSWSGDRSWDQSGSYHPNASWDRSGSHHPNASWDQSSSQSWSGGDPNISWDGQQRGPGWSGGPMGPSQVQSAVHSQVGSAVHAAQDPSWHGGPASSAHPVLPEAPPAKRKTGLMIGLAVVGVLLCGTAVAIALMGSGGDDESTGDEAAETKDDAPETPVGDPEPLDIDLGDEPEPTPPPDENVAGADGAPPSGEDAEPDAPSSPWETVEVAAFETSIGLDDIGLADLQNRFPDNVFDLSFETGVRTQRSAQVPALEVMTVEVSAGDWRFVAPDPSVESVCSDNPVLSETDSDPVVGVGAAEAQAFCTAIGMRLPTATELEALTRGADGREYGFDGALTDARIEELAAGPRSADAWNQTPEGIVALSGGVREWVRCTKADDGSYCVDGFGYRGGSSQSGPFWMHASVMGLAIADPACHRGADIGFRCVKTID